jgi:hypothetical protein
LIQTCREQEAYKQDLSGSEALRMLGTPGKTDNRKNPTRMSLPATWWVLFMAGRLNIFELSVERSDIKGKQGLTSKTTCSWQLTFKYRMSKGSGFLLLVPCGNIRKPFMSFLNCEVSQRFSQPALISST